MAYDNLRAVIAANVFQNNENRVTADMVKTAMNEMVNSLGAEFQFGGVAEPGDNPGTPDYKVAYLASTPGTYSNFGGITLADGEVVNLKWDGAAWSKEVVAQVLGVAEDPNNEGFRLLLAGAVQAVVAAQDSMMSVNNALVDADFATLTRVGTISGKVVTDTGLVGSGSYDVWVYAITPGKNYVITGAFAAGINRRFVYYSSDAAAANIVGWDKYVGSSESTETQKFAGPLTIPQGASYILLNIRTVEVYSSQASVSNIERSPLINVKQIKTALSAAMTMNKGFYIASDHLIEDRVGSKRYIYNPEWDCMSIFVEGATKIKVNGLNVGANYRFYKSVNIFTGENVIDEFIGMNQTGVVPDGAALCIINTKKTSYPSGYAEFFLEKEYAKTINLLLIGNSAGQDALAYVPFILRNMGISRVRLGLLMQSNSNLEDHVDNFNNEAAAYTFYFFDSSDEEESWKDLGSKTIQWALDNYKWNVVSFHQGANSATSQYSGSIQPHLNQIANLISAYIDYPIKFAFYQNQSRAAATINGANWSDEVINEHFAKTCDYCRRILNETIFERIIPVGTAIQNARTIAAIKALGAYASDPDNTSGEGYLCYDGIHLQEGLPAQLAAYVFVLALLEMYGYNELSINGENTRADSTWTAGKGIPGPHGSPIGISDANCLIAQKCAIMAMKNPFEVTDMNSIVSPA